MANRKHDAAAGQLLDRVHDAVDLGCGGDDAYTNRLVLALAMHEPILRDGEVVCAVDLFERLDLLLRREQELGGVCATLSQLDERTFCMPSEERRRVRGAVGAQEVEELGVERTFLRLGDKGVSDPEIYSVVKK